MNTNTQLTTVSKVLVRQQARQRRIDMRCAVRAYRKAMKIARLEERSLAICEQVAKRYGFRSEDVFEAELMDALFQCERQLEAR